MATAKKVKVRPTITEPALKAELKKLFNNGKTGKTDLWVLLSTKYQLGRSRYFKIYDTTHLEWAKLKEQGTNEGTVAGAKKAVQSGIQSKIERVLILQDQIKACIEELESGKCNGKKLTVFEKVALRKTIKELQSEISKIENDYAATRTEITGKDGKPLPIAPTPIVFLSADKLTDEQLEQFMSNDRTDDENI